MRYRYVVTVETDGAAPERYANDLRHELESAIDDTVDDWGLRVEEYLDVPPGRFVIEAWLEDASP